LSLDQSGAAFDAYAESYDDALNRGLAVAGEGKEYFARRRVEWIAKRLRALAVAPRSVLDYGCGTGSSIPFLIESFGPDRVTGIDVSEGSLAVARRELGSDRVGFATVEGFQPDGSYDLVLCNGVFHHIPVAERASAVATIRRALRPGGVFAFWENNPWNPGTRLVMSRIPFDRDAITLTPPEARRLLREGGFVVVRTDFLFIFPKALGFLRAAEPIVAGAPLGAQYMVLCRNGPP
jgi:SAM-dependent methyltransferase